MQNWADRNNWGPRAPNSTASGQSPAMFLNQLMALMQQGGNAGAALQLLAQTANTAPERTADAEAERLRTQPPPTCRLGPGAQVKRDRNGDDDDAATREETEPLTEHEQAVARLEADNGTSP